MAVWPPVKKKDLIICDCTPSITLPNASTAPSTSLLLSLPPEIRLIIYELLLSTPELIKICSHTNSRGYPQPLRNKGLSTPLLRCCKSVYLDAIPILYGSNRFVFEHIDDISSFRHSRLKKHKCEKGQDSYMLGTDPSISAGRFHYVSNITLAPTKSCYCSYQAQWDYLSSKPCDRNERHIFPQLKTLNIDVTELQIPKGSLLNVERILEDISDVDEVHLCGLEILPPRIAGVLRSVRYSDEQVMEDSPSIVNGNNAGQWGSVAGEMSKPSYNSTLLAWKALKSWEAQKMKDDERAIEEMMAEEGEYDDQAMEALKSCGAQKLKDDEWAIEEMMAKGSGVR